MALATGATALELGVLAVTLLSAAAIAVGLAVAGRVDRRRSILVHAPTDASWEFVRRFPELHSRHGKANDLGSISEWVLRRGDGEGAGTLWRARGFWEGKEYWADVEILRHVPGREIAVCLRGDSLGTHRGLRGHIGSFTLEPVGHSTTKVTWRLRARLRSPRLLLERLGSGTRLHARLLDQRLRSLKVEIDGATRGVGVRPSTPSDPPEAVPAPPAGPMRVPPETTL